MRPDAFAAGFEVVEGEWAVLPALSARTAVRPGQCRLGREQDELLAVPCGAHSQFFEVPFCEVAAVSRMVVVTAAQLLLATPLQPGSLHQPSLCPGKSGMDDGDREVRDRHGVAEGHRRLFSRHTRRLLSRPESQTSVSGAVPCIVSRVCAPRFRPKSRKGKACFTAEPRSQSQSWTRGEAVMMSCECGLCKIKTGRIDIWDT